jgi:hypothetical protein
MLALVIGGATLVAGACQSGWPGSMNWVRTRLVRQVPIRSAGGPYATTDRHLATLEIQDPSETVRTALAGLPPGEAAALIIPRDLPDSLTIFYSLSYLSWPRPFGELICGDSPRLIYLAKTAGPVKWLLFYRANLPADLAPSAKMIGPHLALTPAKELRDWRSYCSPSGF